jgi:glycogen debranching enzyme
MNSMFLRRSGRRPARFSVVRWWFMTLLCGWFGLAGAQQGKVANEWDQTTEAVGPQRFIAAHGRKAVMDGYATQGLEMWAYPFQVLSDYRVSFLVAGTTTPVDGAGVLRRVEYRPDSLTRVYVGPDFVVHERVFVPLNEASAIVTYTVQGRSDLRILVHAKPVMNLMWPAAVGGQQIAWNAAARGFVLTEAQDRYSAMVGSPEIVAHDPATNRTTGGLSEAGLGFTLRPGTDGTARVYCVLHTPGDADVTAQLQDLVQQQDALDKEYAAHVLQVTRGMLQVTTPDAQWNEALAWSEIALDQAWVCNHDLGCGYVAGYGPSRGARRPQYDWFFAGDGSIAADAAVADGHGEQAREELEFILHYQDKKTGMVWHELSQSAGFLDWAGKYPYMYVHVDITFQFLGTVGRYVVATGDIAFVRQHWQELEAAYRYCASLIGPRGLPLIPADKEGGDEQDRMSEDLGLSASWVAATSAFGKMAGLTAHPDLAKEAAAANEKARAAIQARYWDSASNFWIQGYTEAGRAMEERRSSPGLALALHLFSPNEENQLMDQLAGAAFQADWGTLGVSNESKGFDPGSYGKGSVSALGTSELAIDFWTERRPMQALGLLRALLPWFSLDSLGHLHEVLAGDVYRPQEESVPEQTWSSAGFVSATVQGLLGLEVDGLKRKIVFAPHLPSEWHEVTVAGVAMGESRVSFAVQQSATEVTLKIENPGDAFELEFDPQVALGAISPGAVFNGKSLSVRMDQHPEETAAEINVKVPHGSSEIQLKLEGGINLRVPTTQPMLGAPSTGIRLVNARLAGDALHIVADVNAHAESNMDLESAWPLGPIEGAEAESVRPGVTRLHFPETGGKLLADGYRRVQATVSFKR